MFPSSGWHLPQGLTAVPFPCATALLCMEESVNSRCSRGSYLMFIAAIRTSTFLKRTEFTLLYEEVLKVVWSGAKCCHFDSVVQKMALLKSWRQQFCLIIRQVRKFLLHGPMWISRDYVQEIFRNSWSRWLRCISRGIILFIVSLGKLSGGSGIGRHL